MPRWIWRFLGWLIPIAVGAGVAIWVYKKETNKALTYQVVSMSPLAAEARGFGSLRLLRNGKAIEQPFLITIRLTNAGDVDILASDFATPLTLKPVWRAGPALGLPGGSIVKLPFKGTADDWVGLFPHVVDARVANTNPAGIPAEIIVKPDRVQLRPLLLNATDQIVVEMLISGNPAALEVSGRVAGIKQISEEPSEKARTEALIYIALGVGLLFGGVLTTYSGLALLVRNRAALGLISRIPTRLYQWLAMAVTFLIGTLGVVFYFALK